VLALGRHRHEPFRRGLLLAAISAPRAVTHSASSRAGTFTQLVKPSDLIRRCRIGQLCGHGPRGRDS